MVLASPKADIDIHEVLNLCCEKTRNDKLIFAREGVRFHKASEEVLALSKLWQSIDTALDHAIQRVVKDMVREYSA